MVSAKDWAMKAKRSKATAPVRADDSKIVRVAERMEVDSRSVAEGSEKGKQNGGL